MQRICTFFLALCLLAHGVFGGALVAIAVANEDAEAPLVESLFSENFEADDKARSRFKLWEFGGKIDIADKGLQLQLADGKSSNPMLRTTDDAAFNDDGAKPVEYSYWHQLTPVGKDAVNLLSLYARLGSASTDFSDGYRVSRYVQGGLGIVDLVRFNGGKAKSLKTINNSSLPELLKFEPALLRVRFENVQNAVKIRVSIAFAQELGVLADANTEEVLFEVEDTDAQRLQSGSGIGFNFHNNGTKKPLLATIGDIAVTREK